jgi:hypothetical protein
MHRTARRPPHVKVGQVERNSLQDLSAGARIGPSATLDGIS